MRKGLGDLISRSFEPGGVWQGGEDSPIGMEDTIPPVAPMALVPKGGRRIAFRVDKPFSQRGLTHGRGG